MIGQHTDFLTLAISNLRDSFNIMELLKQKNFDSVYRDAVLHLLKKLGPQNKTTSYVSLDNHYTR